MTAPRFSFFDDLSIRTKAFAASAVLLVCLVLLGAIAYVTLDRSQDGLRSLTTTVLPKQQAFAAVKDAIVAVQMKTFRYVSWASNGISATLLQSLSGQIDAARQETLVECLMGVVLVPIAVPWGYVVRQFVRAPGERWRSKERGAG